MRDRNYSKSTLFLSVLFGDAEGAVELRVCPNERGAFPAKSVFTRDPDEIIDFCRQHDRPGAAVYFGVCTRRDGAPSGNKATIHQAPALWVDIDCAKQGLKGDDMIAALEFLPFPPSTIVNSGGGLHAYWQLEEAANVAGPELYEPIEALCRRLALILAGDTSCAEAARILRLPGTLNSKPATLALNDGEPIECSVISETGRAYDLVHLAEWIGEQRVVLHGAVAPGMKPVREDDPFVAYAKEAGFNPGIDIDADLTAMTHGASGQCSIHATQLRVSASMIARGYEDDEIVDRILAATEAAAPHDTQWNWAAEERSIRAMIRTGRAKGYERPRAASGPVPASNGNTALAVVHDLDQEREKRAAPKVDPEQKKLDEISALGTAVLGVWQERYGPIIHSRGTTYAYEKGVWSVWDEQHDQVLRAMLQEACVSLGKAPKTALLNAATVFFMNRPSLLIRDVEFDQHGLIIAEDATINPRSMEITPHSPDHRAMFKVGAKLEGPRECSTFLRFLADSFSDKGEDEPPQIIRTVQEWFGACLVANKSRALAKGLLVYGGSRTGKTQLSEVLRALLGRNQTSATSAGDIGSDFGLQPFLGKRGWVADDAIGQDEFLDAERYKKIVTGEEIGVRRKNRTDVMARFGFPVLLTANNLPKIKDQSDAVYNRSLVLPMTNVRPEGMPEPGGYQSIAAKIIAEELTGVLWWAIEGWQRLSARGVFTPPQCMTKAIIELQDSNNKVGAWMRECIVADVTSKVASADLFASFAGWYYLENGDGKFPWSQNGFTRKVREAMPLLGTQSGVKTRNLTGLRLTETGIEYWSINASRDGPNVPKGAALDQFQVNQDYSISHAERAAEARQDDENRDRRPRF